MSKDTWAEEVRRSLIPALDSAKVAVSIAPPADAEIDVQFAVELGLSILMNKPIVLAVRPDQPLPAKLLRVADRVIDLPVDPEMFASKVAEVLDARPGSGLFETDPDDPVSPLDGLHVADPEPYLMTDPEPYLIADEASSVIVEGMDPDGGHYQRLVMIEFTGRTSGEGEASTRVMMTREGAVSVAAMLTTTIGAWP